MRYKAIHWKDGMKVNKDHFIGTENALREEMIDYAANHLTSYSYGLFPIPRGTSSLDWYFKVDQSQQLVVSLLICQGITSGGVRVNVSPDDQHLEELRIPMNSIAEKIRSESDVLYVYVDVQNFDRTPYGKPNPLEQPERQPFTQAKCRLNIGFIDPASSANSKSTQLIIGRIIRKGGVPQRDQTYIPPCICIKSQEELVKKFNSWNRILEQLVANGIKTINRIYEITAQGKNSIEFEGGKKVSVAEGVNALTKGLLEELATILPQFKQLLREKPPVYTLLLIQQLAWKMKMNLGFLSSSVQNQFLNYLKESVGVEHFLKPIDKMIQHKYQHYNILETVNSIDLFLGILAKIYDPVQGLPIKDFAWRVIKEEENDEWDWSSKEEDNSTLA